MTGLDYMFNREFGESNPHSITLTFKPDKIPKSDVDWFEILGNYCLTYSKILAGKEGSPK